MPGRARKSRASSRVSPCSLALATTAPALIGLKSWDEGEDGGVIDSRGEVVVAHLVAFREAAGEVDEETLAEAALFIEDAVAAVDGDVDQFDFDHRGKG